MAASSARAEVLQPAANGAVNSFVLVPRVTPLPYKDLRVRTMLGWQNSPVTCRAPDTRVSAYPVGAATTHTIAGGAGLPYGFQLDLTQPAHLITGSGVPVAQDACRDFPRTGYLGIGLGDPVLRLSWGQRVNDRVAIGAFASGKAPVSRALALAISPSPLKAMYPMEVAQFFGDAYGALTLGAQIALNNEFMEGTAFAAGVGRIPSPVGGVTVGSGLAYGGAFEISALIHGLNFLAEIQGQVRPALPAPLTMAGSSTWQLPLESLAALRYNIWHIGIGVAVGVGFIPALGNPAVRTLIYLEYAPLNEIARKRPLFEIEWPDFDINLAAESVLTKEPVPPQRRTKRKKKPPPPPAEPLPEDFECPPETGAHDDILFDPRCPILEGPPNRCHDGFCPLTLNVQVYFETNSAALSPRQRARLEYYLLAHAERRIAAVHITGHADAVGDDGYNQLLSRARALVVQGAVRSLVPDAPTVLDHEGEGLPVIDSEVAEEENRRVDVRIEYEGSATE